jgi:uncharacterized integral membrane protein (TIGR00698 family)
MGGSLLERFTDLIPGVTYCAIIAVFSFITWRLYKPVSCLMWAFIFSIVFANVVKLPERVAVGARFCSSRLLKATIAVLGLVTNALIWFQVGIGVVNALVVIAVSFFLSVLIGRRLGLSDRLSLLIGVGTSICGASAIAAAAPAIDAREEEIGLALSGITLFGLLSMALYPFMFRNTAVGGLLMENLNVYAIWVGSGVHETAQVIGAAGMLGDGVIQPAMMIKSIRIFMIGPAVLLATYMYNREGVKESGRKALVLPAFALFFIANSVISAFLNANAGSLMALGVDWLSLKSLLSGSVIPFLLATAFAGVGSKVQFRTIARLGVKPFAVSALISVLAGWLALLLAVLVAPYVPPYA